jgi:hypothetical protein
LVVLAVALLSAVVGYQIARDGGAGFPRIDEVNLLDHRGLVNGGPPSCYGNAPGHDVVRENNPNCGPGSEADPDGVGPGHNPNN